MNLFLPEHFSQVLTQLERMNLYCGDVTLQYPSFLQPMHSRDDFTSIQSGNTTL